MPAPLFSARRRACPRRWLRAAGLLALVVFLAGCDEGTVDRIKEKPAVFNALSEAEKKRVIDGVFEVGDSADMVYMAIGTPVRVKSKVIPEGTIEMWTYINYITTHGAASLSLNNPPNVKYKAPQNSPSDVAQSLAVPEAEANTLYIFFLNGRVTQIKLDTQGRK